jgi:hypothetical protein
MGGSGARRAGKGTQEQGDVDALQQEVNALRGQLDHSLQLVQSLEEERYYHKQSRESRTMEVDPRTWELGPSVPERESVSAIAPKRSELVQWLTKNGMEMTMVGKFLELGCDSLEILRVLREEDWDRVGISLGKKRWLQHALNGRNESPTRAVAHETQVQCPTEPPGQLLNNIFIGMGVQGDQKPYLDICDYVSVRSPFDEVSGPETTISHKPDGSFEVKPSTVKRVSLEKITMAQWVEANAQIMARLLVKGMQPRDYLSYTVLTAQLAQKYEWLSVLLFDREYRRLQANIGFLWGTDFGHLRDVLLVPKVKPWQTQGSRFEGRRGSQNMRREQRGQGRAGLGRGQYGQRNQTQQQLKRDPMPDGKFKLCRSFNRDKCTWDNCVFKHFCAVCGSGAHGEVGHPKG